ncbi:MAG: hypothetical protein ACRD1Z_15080 [Vicinamibacteria bacterium]
MRSLEISLVNVDPEQLVRTSLLSTIRLPKETGSAVLSVDSQRKRLVLRFAPVEGEGEEARGLDRRSFVADLELNERREIAAIQVRFTGAGVTHPPLL